MFICYYFCASSAEPNWQSVKCFLSELCPQFNQNAFGLNKIIDPQCWDYMLTLSFVVPNLHPLSIIELVVGVTWCLTLSASAADSRHSKQRSSAHAGTVRPLKSALSFYSNSTQCHNRYKKKRSHFIFYKKKKAKKTNEPSSRS